MAAFLFLLQRRYPKNSAVINRRKAYGGCMGRMNDDLNAVPWNRGRFEWLNFRHIVSRKKNPSQLGS